MKYLGILTVVLCLTLLCAGIGYAETYYGTTDGTESSDYGIKGEATSSEAGSSARGVVGITNSRKGIGVFGVANRSTGKKYGVKGTTKSSTTGTAGVYGLATKSVGTTYGVYGRNNSTSGYAGYFVGGMGVRIPVLSSSPSDPANGTMWVLRGQSGLYYRAKGITRTILTMPKTGQTTSYADYDDGYYEKGATALQDNGDGTVTDIRTGLMWPKDGTGDGYNSGDQLAWAAALTWAEALDFAGYTDWRLPNINELISFQEITWAHYQGQPTGWYWSSTTDALNTANATVMASEGGPSTGDKTSGLYVVAVRGGE